MTQVFFTARELADIATKRGITAFPQTERGVRIVAEREGWNALPTNLCRKRAGTIGGGGREYHVSLLPDLLVAALTSTDVKAQLTKAHTAETAADVRQLAALRISALPARRREVLHARAEILRSIEGYGIAQGESRAWAIARFIDSLVQYQVRQDVEDRRDAGLPLTDREAASLRISLTLTTPGGFEVPADRVRTANDRPQGAVKISRATIYDWFKARDEHGVLALAPAPTKERDPIPAGFVGFLKFYALPSKPSASDALGEYLKTVTDPAMSLTIGQVRHVLKVKLNNIEKHIGREGILTLRSRMAYITRTTDDLWPTTIYTSDGKTFDAEVADPITRLPIRPEITTVLDVATRKCVGFALSRSENAMIVAEALRRSCTAHGICAIFYTDRGPGFKNQMMDADVSGLMGRLGIAKMHALPYGSQAKGLIERPNATVWDTLAKRMPTYIGSDMDKEAGQKVHKKTRSEIKEFGQSRLLPSWDDFLKLCNDRVEEYNNTPHRGLPKFDDPQTGRRRHMSPNEAWEAHASNGFEPVPVDAEDSDDLFRPYEIRTASRAEVAWNTNKYFHADLEAYHDQKVMVGYDYNQADKVWVREYDVASGQPGKLICVAEFGGNSQRYVPLTYQQAAEEQRTKARLQRLDRKIEAVEAERTAPYMIEQQAVDPMPFIDVTPIQATMPGFALAIDNTAGEDPKPISAHPRRQVFGSDEELATWALKNPNQLTPNQIVALQRCMSSSTARELFRMSGIDTEALRTLLRAVA